MPTNHFRNFQGLSCSTQETPRLERFDVWCPRGWKEVLVGHLQRIFMVDSSLCLLRTSVDMQKMAMFEKMFLHCANFKYGSFLIGV